MSSAPHLARDKPPSSSGAATVMTQDLQHAPRWYTRKWGIGKHRIAIAGSGMAMQMGHGLREQGFHCLDVEPPPPALRRERWRDHGYDQYSARYGDIYSSRQLKQLLQRALDEFVPMEQPWSRDGGFVDPFRPRLEASPMSSEEEVVALQAAHLTAVARLFSLTDVFVIALGLTETWLSSADGAAFPLRPGTEGGSFEASRYRLVNLGFPAVCADMEQFIARARSLNPKMRFILTVSIEPPLTTATTKHAVVANSYSKSVLRAVAGHLESKYACVDYFPSYEILNSPLTRDAWFEPDLRTVSAAGMAHVMTHFLSEHIPPQRRAANPEPLAATVHEAEICEEALLAAFGPSP